MYLVLHESKIREHMYGY